MVDPKTLKPGDRLLYPTRHAELIDAKVHEMEFVNISAPRQFESATYLTCRRVGDDPVCLRYTADELFPPSDAAAAYRELADQAREEEFHLRRRTEEIARRREFWERGAPYEPPGEGR